MRTIGSVRPRSLLPAAALYALSVAVLRTSHLGSGWPFVDLAIYRDGGKAVLSGAPLYHLRFPGALAFTYPPLSALAFTLLTPFGMAMLEPLATVASLLLLPGVLALALRLRPVRTWMTAAQTTRIALLCSALAVWLEPVWTTLRYGQIDLLVAALVLFDLALGQRRRWHGAGIGLAAGLKLTPAIFAVYLLLTGRVRAALVSVAAFAATVALGFALVPGDARSFWGGIFADASRIGRPENAANQSLRGAYVRLAHSVAVGPLWLISAIAVGTLGVALAARAGRRGDDARGYSLCALSALLVSPVSWSHHWVLAVPALVLLALDALRRASAPVLAASGVIAAVALSHMIWWVPVNHPEHSELHLDALQLVWADSYVLIALLALAAATWSVALERWR
jgi:alpha-1,2-mannosyltransferase